MDKIRHNKPDENGIYHRPAYGFALNVIGALSIEEQREFWRIHDREHRSEKAEERRRELLAKAHFLWESLTTS